MEDDVAEYRMDGNRVTNGNTFRVICRGGSNEDVPWRTTSYDDPLPTYGAYIVPTTDLRNICCWYSTSTGTVAHSMHQIQQMWVFTKF
jgi:hypothetical protein